MLTLSQAAQQLGVTAATLRQQIHAGHLKGEKIGPIWIITEAALATYRLNNHGRIGRPFVGRPGYVDTQHVRVRLLFAPADGRGHDAIWLQYLRQSFVFDLDLTNPKAFRWTSEPYEDLTPETTPPGGRVIELWNREHVAREISARRHDVDALISVDPTFPAPVVTFHDGPVWDATAIERWWATRGAARTS
jgi:excisionase family DNA binding protein